MPQFFRSEAKQYGFWAAVSRLSHRRHLPLLGYLILALAVGYAFQVERTHSNENKQELAQATHNVLVNVCRTSNNKLRTDLRQILLAFETAKPPADVIKAAHEVRDPNARKVLLTFVDTSSSPVLVQSIKKLHNANCEKIYSGITATKK